VKTAHYIRPVSGAGTSLKVGTHIRHEAREFSVLRLHFFGSLVQLVILVNVFVMDSTVGSVSSLLF